MKSILFILVIIPILLLFVACPEPGTTYSISGIVKDRITGDGVYNVSVSIGNKNTSTDVNGEFSISYSEAQTVTGGVYVSKGIGYSFWGVQNVSIDVTNNPTYTFWIQPTIGALQTQTISGDFTLGTSANQQMQILVINSNGGATAANITSLNATSYSATTYTFGSDCIVWIVYNDDTSALSQYYSNQNFDPDLTIDVDDLTGTDATINGTTGDGFQIDLSIANYLDIPSYLQGIMAGPSGVAEIYNPDSFPLIIKNAVSQANTPEINYTTATVNMSAVTPFSSPYSFTLPSKPALAPSGIVSSQSWTEATRTISFDAATGANLYMLQFDDDTSGGGFIFSNSTDIVLPQLFYSDVIDLGGGWDVAFTPIYSSDSNINHYIDMELGPGGPIEMSNLTIGFIQGPGVANFIQ